MPKYQKTRKDSKTEKTRDSETVPQNNRQPPFSNVSRLTHSCGTMAAQVVRPRVVGIAIDQTFAKNFTCKADPEIPDRINAGGQIHQPNNGEKEIVRAAYHAFRERLGLLGYELDATDECQLDANLEPQGLSALGVEDGHGNAIGSFDGRVIALSCPAPGDPLPKKGAVDVKYTRAYQSRRGLSSGFRVLQAADLLRALTNPDWQCAVTNLYWARGKFFPFPVSSRLLTYVMTFATLPLRYI